ncbi:MAG: gluconate 2-dehydrogenase subunit 3 family protein [Steroidobacteraceae bacterium]
MNPKRRDFIAGAGWAVFGSALPAGARANRTAGASRTPARAGAGPRGLSRGIAAVLARAGESMLPGAAAAGIADFVGSQLALPAHRQGLLIRYLMPGPHRTFYVAGLGALEAASLERFHRPFARLSDAQAGELLEDLRNARLPRWSGPPQPLLHFILRNDALDVVYGTRAGFARLGVPYMAHLEPPAGWPT